MSELEVLNFQVMMAQIWGCITFAVRGMTLILLLACFKFSKSKNYSRSMNFELLLGCAFLNLSLYISDPTLNKKEILEMNDRKATIKKSSLYKIDFQKILLNQDLTSDEKTIKALIKLETGKEYGVLTTKQKSEGEVMKEYMEAQALLKFEIEQIDKLIELSGGKNE